MNTIRKQLIMIILGAWAIIGSVVGMFYFPAYILALPFLLCFTVGVMIIALYWPYKYLIRGHF